MKSFLITYVDEYNTRVTVMIEACSMALAIRAFLARPLARQLPSAVNFIVRKVQEN